MLVIPPRRGEYWRTRLRCCLWMCCSYRSIAWLFSIIYKLRAMTYHYPANILFLIEGFKGIFRNYPFVIHEDHGRYETVIKWNFLLPEIWLGKLNRSTRVSNFKDPGYSATTTAPLAFFTILWGMKVECIGSHHWSERLYLKSIRVSVTISRLTWYGDITVINSFIALWNFHVISRKLYSQRLQRVTYFWPTSAKCCRCRTSQIYVGRIGFLPTDPIPPLLSNLGSTPFSVNWHH